MNEYLEVKRRAIMEKGETDKKVESAYFFYKAPSKNSDLIGLAPRIEETYFLPCWIAYIGGSTP